MWKAKTEAPVRSRALPPQRPTYSATPPTTYSAHRRPGTRHTTDHVLGTPPTTYSADLDHVFGSPSTHSTRHPRTRPHHRFLTSRSYKPTHKCTARRAAYRRWRPTPPTRRRRSNFSPTGPKRNYATAPPRRPRRPGSRKHSRPNHPSAGGTLSPPRRTSRRSSAAEVPRPTQSRRCLSFGSWAARRRTTRRPRAPRPHTTERGSTPPLAVSRRPA